MKKALVVSLLIVAWLHGSEEVLYQNSEDMEEINRPIEPSNARQRAWERTKQYGAQAWNFAKENKAKIGASMAAALGAGLAYKYYPRPSERPMYDESLFSRYPEESNVSVNESIQLLEKKLSGSDELLKGFEALVQNWSKYKKEIEAILRNNQMSFVDSSVMAGMQVLEENNKLFLEAYPDIAKALTPLLRWNPQRTDHSDSFTLYPPNFQPAGASE